MSTFVDGVGASENIDSTGERIIIAGMDISSLAVDGIANWEHKSDNPDQIVGKVLKAKKIFSEKDCEDERQTYFWSKTGVPFVYVLIELFDDYKESAKEVAGMFRYDQDKKGQNEKNVMNFSIEGAKIEKKGIDIVKSIARKVTITPLPANKAAIAEMVPANKNKKDDIDSLFKTETNVEIELIKSEDMGELLAKITKSANSRIPPKPPENKGSLLGSTKSGKEVHSHERIHNYKDFTKQDHKDASAIHHESMLASKDSKTTQHHTGKKMLHLQAANTAEKRETRMNRAGSTVKSGGAGPDKIETSVLRPYAKVDNLPAPVKKSMTAGSGMGSPGILTGGAALAKQCIDPKMHKGCTHEMPTLAKADEKGIHTPARGSSETVNRGTSDAGLMARAASNGKAPFKPGGKERQMDAVKLMHTRKLTELKAMPKPNLTKSVKGVHTQADKLTPGVSNAGAAHRIKTDVWDNEHSDGKDITGDAKKMHQQKLGELKAMPKPNLTKAEDKPDKSTVHEGIHEINGVNHHVRITKIRKGVYKGVASPGEHHIQAPGSVHTIGVEHVPQKNGYKVTHEAPYGEGTNKSPTSTAVRSLITSKVKEHNETMKKSENHWYNQAKTQYDQWDKKDQFVEFMSARMPKMTKSEIDVFGATMLLKKNMESENALESLIKSDPCWTGYKKVPGKKEFSKGSCAPIKKALKFGSEADQASTAKFVEEQKNKPKAPKTEHKPEPELKGRVKTEVSHVEKSYSTNDTHGDTVHLKSGHKVTGVKNGTHKVGDKVTVSNHAMGARNLESGHND